MWAPTDEVRAGLRGGFECLCNPGYEPDGEGGCKPRHIPDLCADHDCPCNCLCVPHKEEQGYLCEPEKGFRKIVEPGSERNASSLRLDVGICVSIEKPRMTLMGENPYRLRQGDDYVERGAEINDPSISKALTRRIKVSYPDGQLGHCVASLGDYIVSYQLDEGSRGEPEETTVDEKNRTVIISDVNECEYTGVCERFIPKCSIMANCQNLVGSYRCTCPTGYVGDGRVDGIGCADARPPSLSCSGAGCHSKVFRAADIRGLVSDDGQYKYMSNTSDLSFVTYRIQHIFDESKAMGKDLFCETADPIAGGKPCFVAYDDAYGDNGTAHRVDLTPNITVVSIAMPNQTVFTVGTFHANTSAMRFTITYSVTDAAKNTATASREVIVTVQSNDMRAQLTGERIAFVVKRVLAAITVTVAIALAAVWIWTFRTSLLVFAQIAPYTLAYVALPSHVFGKLTTRRQFVAAVDCWLCISRLGMLSEHERLTLALQQFSDVQNGED